MALSGLTFDTPKAYGKGWVLMALKVTIGSSGAVSSVDGKGWPSDGTASTAPMQSGGVTHDTDGEYTITLPGNGSVHDIFLVNCAVEDASDLLIDQVKTKDLSARSLTLLLTDPGSDTVSPAAADPSDGTILHVTLLVKNSNID